MSKDILGGFGPNSSQPQASVITNGGKPSVKDVHNYSPPVGPKGIDDAKSPGLHGTNHGCCVTQGKH